MLKNITTGGEGGAAVWRDFEALDRDLNDEVEQTMRLLGDHGQTSRDKKSGWEYDIALFGYNSIMTNIDAAMGLAQLERFDEIREKRIEVTCRYDRLFENACVEPLIQHFGSDYTSAMHLYPIRLPGKHLPSDQYRNEAFARLRDLGVPCNVHYKPLPMMTAYKNIGFDINDYPNAFEMYRTLLTIPYHTDLTEKEQEYVFDCIRKVVLSI